MRQSTILAAASIFATLGSAAKFPHNRLHGRGVAMVTETTVVTDWSTVWVTGEPPVATAVSAAAVQHQPWQQPQGGPPPPASVPTSLPAGGAPFHTAPPLSGAAPSSVRPIVPGPSSVAPVVPAPSSVAPVVPVPSSSAPAAPAPSSGGTTGSEANLLMTKGTTYSGGEITYYSGGLGSCGWNIGVDDAQVAVSHEFMEKYGGSNSSPLCGRMLTIVGPGGTFTAKVADTCEGCVANHLDLPSGFYDKVSSNNENAGHVPISYTWN